MARALLLALLGALAADAISGSSTTSTATSRVAVSEEVVWPFYASAREQLVQIAREPAVRRAVVEQVAGPASTDIELSAEPSGGEIVVELTAESADGSLAIEAANVFAERVVAVGAERTRADRGERVADLEESIAAADARLADNDAELLRLGAALDALVEPVPRAEQAVLQSQVQQVESAQREDARLRAAQVQALFDARLAVDRAESDFTVISPADRADFGVFGDPATVVLLAAIPLFLVGLGLSVLWDQTYGLVRRPADIRWASQLPVATVAYRRTPDDPEFVDANSLVRRVRRHQIPGSRWLLVPLGATAARLADALATRLTDVELDRTRRPDLDRPTGADHDRPGDVGSGEDGTGQDGSGQGGSGQDGSGRPIVPDGHAPTATGDTRLRERAMAGRPQSRLLVGRLASLDETDAATVSGAVLVVVRRRGRISAVRSALAELAVEGLPVEAIVLLDHRKR